MQQLAASVRVFASRQLLASSSTMMMIATAAAAASSSSWRLFTRRSPRLLQPSSAMHMHTRSLATHACKCSTKTSACDAATDGRKRIVIVGGVAGGASAAARARRLDERAIITVLERGPNVSFANCGLPYHIGGTIANRSALELHTPASLARQLNIDVHTHANVTSIDRVRKTVTVMDGASGESCEVPYDALILSPGASPIRPPLPGFDHPRVVTLRTLADMDAIKRAVGSGSGSESKKHVTVVGAGFIGLEMAEQLTEAGHHVTVVELQPQVLPQADADMALALQRELEAHGVSVKCGEAVMAVEHSDDTCEVKLKSGGSIPASLVVLSVGVRPDTNIARAAKLNCNASGHIIVNEWQQTSDPNIYAVGDAVETADAVVPGARAKVALGGPANRQGRVAADHIFRAESAKPYPGSIGTAIVRVFSQTLAVTGWSSAALRRANVPFATTIVIENDHAGYYPGATPMVLKLLWSPTDGRILGAQGFGQKGVDKRIDVIATAVRAGMTIDDLTHLELAYAPPFNSAKDPVNVLGFVAGNQRDKLVTMTADLAAFIKQNANDGGAVMVVDVREAATVAGNALLPAATQGATSVNIPFAELRSRLHELDPNARIVTVCNRGKTSYFAARVLQQAGLQVTSLSGGVTHNAHLTRAKSTESIGH